jgi:hypothetical protein
MNNMKCYITMTQMYYYKLDGQLTEKKNPVSVFACLMWTLVRHVNYDVNNIWGSLF